MSLNMLFVQLSIALFAFLTVPVQVEGSPKKTDAMYDDDFPSELSENAETCDFEALPEDVYFLYYSRDVENGTVLDFESPPKDGSILDSAQTKIVTHGFRDSLDLPELKILLKAYLNDSENINVLALDWKTHASDKYRDAVKSTFTVGKAIASIFCMLYKNYDIYPFQIHFIGHNLGAHLLANAARESETKVGRITGLDPARLCFEDQCHGMIYPQLSKNDATFVDVVHTNVNLYGVRYCHGTADFYANDGKMQPRCHKPWTLNPNKCDSRSSYLYFAESIGNPFAFYGNYCTTAFSKRNCTSNIGAFWGEHMETTLGGPYNFITSENSPFGKGKPK